MKKGTQARMHINPAEGRSEVVTVIRVGTKANRMEGWNRVRRSNGSTVWTPLSLTAI